MGNNKLIIAANWKMNLLLEEGKSLAASIKENIKDIGDVEVVLLPSATLLSEISKIISDSPIKLGAQNCHEKENGAYTGDISAAQLKDLGCEYVLCGHSERRQYHGETSELVSKKAASAIAAGIIPIVCVGETLDVREAGGAVDLVKDQIRESLFAGANSENCLIAYEPVWAIGTGKTATPEDIKEIHDAIIEVVESEFSSFGTPSVLYGGSVNVSNVGDILAIDSVKGALVGGASLKLDEFAEMIKISNEIKTAA